jgi:hypothetical protein
MVDFSIQKEIKPACDWMLSNEIESMDLLIDAKEKTYRVCIQMYLLENSNDKKRAYRI